MNFCQSQVLISLRLNHLVNRLSLSLSVSLSKYVWLRICVSHSLEGAEYNYSTHGWTLISAVIEKVSNKKFLDYMRDHVFMPLGMSSTGGEFHQPLVYSRARYVHEGF